MRFVSLVLLGCMLAGCKVSFIADAADDTGKWQGAWRMVSTTYDGEPQPGDMEWIVDGDHYTIRLNGTSHVDPYTIKLDPSQKHRRALIRGSARGSCPLAAVPSSRQPQCLNAP
jgi:hypothetical protein